MLLEKTTVEEGFTVPLTAKLVSFTKTQLPWGWLSNMSAHPIAIDGEYWRTAEALFQARRFHPQHQVRSMIRTAASPMMAKFIAKRHRAEMEVVPLSDRDVENMRLLLRLKLAQNERTANGELTDLGRGWQYLTRQPELMIVEDCSRRPRGNSLFWGAALIDAQHGRWHGRNQLGELWMELIRMLRENR